MDDEFDDEEAYYALEREIKEAFREAYSDEYLRMIDDRFYESHNVLHRGNPPSEVMWAAFCNGYSTAKKKYQK